MKPVTVIGATTGATMTLKSTLRIETSPDRKMMYGVHSSVAAVEMAMISASQEGIKRSKKALIDGARNINPPVAKTDSTKPGS